MKGVIISELTYFLGETIRDYMLHMRRMWYFRYVQSLTGCISLKHVDNSKLSDINPMIDNPETCNCKDKGPALLT